MVRQRIWGTLPNAPTPTRTLARRPATPKRAFVISDVRNSTKKLLKELGYKSYRAYCLSPWWRLRRERYFKRNPRRCWVCGTRKDIHLHHRSYVRLGKEKDSDLLPLCRTHHRGLHSFMKRKRIPVEKAHLAYKVWLAGRGRL